ncbi:HAD-like protein [Teratosphaeria nubilosa]|uniref:HAD-like protein n=1 Tax=Teratosphaeria nubilosa TaxID=161662 RepID=A0A6G1LQU2_9PEZI|nr:HAD-like protein [Teratosphaeria nubilosa]
MASPSRTNKKPRVLLFDIGGVCVVSPMQAILDYELAHSIPPGWVNYSISQSGRTGAWQQLERGEVLLDSQWFVHFKADLTNEARWRAYYARYLSKQKGMKSSQGAEEAAYQVPGVPDIDAEWLYWEMMRISRTPDPHMWPALQKLRVAADQSNGELMLGALSNTSIFPPGHPFLDESKPEGQQNKHLKSIFDIFISSAHVGMRKPDTEIYDYAIKRLHEFAKTKFPGIERGVRAEDVVFLDDIGANLRTARALGMRTIKVELGRADKAVAELEGIVGLDLGGGGRARL